MIDLESWEKDLTAGLEKLRQQAAELQVRIHRQEGALMLAQELKRQEEQAAAQPAAISADDVEPT